MERDERRRSISSRDAIYEATRDLLREQGYAALTIEGIAARAGVGKQTIYRWWSSKGELASDALKDEIARRIEFPDTGDFLADLTALLGQVAGVLGDPAVGPHVLALLAETQSDEAARHAFLQQTFQPIRSAYRERVALAREQGLLGDRFTDDDILDLAFGPLWFRSLTRPGTIDASFGETVARALFAGGGRPGPGS